MAVRMRAWTAKTIALKQVQTKGGKHVWQQHLRTCDETQLSVLFCAWGGGVGWSAVCYFNFTQQMHCPKHLTNTPLHCDFHLHFEDSKFHSFFFFLNRRIIINMQEMQMVLSRIFHFILICCVHWQQASQITALRRLELIPRWNAENINYHDYDYSISIIILLLINLVEKMIMWFLCLCIRMYLSVALGFPLWQWLNYHRCTGYRLSENKQRTVNGI